jgi:hypothetical protein
MPFPSSPEDRPDPNENMPAMRARIPEHIARGEISTGVIVVTGGTEYVLDFVRNLPRPNSIVARVVLPHMVMPQFIEALSANIELFRQRYGELPGAPTPQTVTHPFQSGPAIVSPSTSAPGNTEPLAGSVDVWSGSQPNVPSSGGDAIPPGAADGTANGGNAAAATPNNSNAPTPNSPNPNGNQSHLKRQNPQDVYDELKIRDEILSGAYANAVMIGHGPYEFSFDFITNFYPQSAVSCRVYLASGHIHRLLESLRASWDQLRPRLGQGPPPNNPPPPRNV